MLFFAVLVAAIKIFIFSDALLDIKNTQDLGMCVLAKQMLQTSSAGSHSTSNSNWACTDESTPIGSVCSWAGVVCDVANVTVIELYLNNELNSIPTEIGLLTSLQQLNLKNIGFGTICTEMGLLTSLTYLSLSYSNINGTIPTQIGVLTRLISLYLDHNYLTGSLPTEIGNLHSLSVLNVAYNKLKEVFPSALGNATSLSELQAAGNTGPSHIPTEIGYLTTLAYLKLYLSNVEGVYHEIVNFLHRE
jgi:Leucine-rich repeat (LRR) protein